jgi:hypothetical protein
VNQFFTFVLPPALTTSESGNLRKNFIRTRNYNPALDLKLIKKPQPDRKSGDKGRDCLCFTVDNSVSNAIPEKLEKLE